MCVCVGKNKTRGSGIMFLCEYVYVCKIKPERVELVCMCESVCMYVKSKPEGVELVCVCVCVK